MKYLTNSSQLQNRPSRKTITKQIPMHPKISTPATKYLDAQDFKYRIFQHTGNVNSVEQAAFERGQKPDQVVRSILFRTSGSGFVLVLMPGPNQINWKSLRSHLGKPRVTMASPEEVLRITGYQIGTVSPFGWKTKLPTLVDISVQTQSEVSLGSGQPGTAIIMKTTDFLNALQPHFEWVNLKE